MKEKKIPAKNYVVYAIIVLVTLIFVFYLNEWYKAYKKSELENSYISKYVTEINYDEFENYIQENPNTIIYIGKTNSEESIKVEKNLYSILKEHDLTNNIVFLNLTDQEKLLKDIQIKYYSNNLKTILERMPSIAIFRDKKISDVLVSDEQENINRSDMLTLLERQEYIK